MKLLCAVPVAQNDAKFPQGAPVQLYGAVLGAALVWLLQGRRGFRELLLSVGFFRS